VFKKILKFLLIVFVWLLLGVALMGGSLLLGYSIEFGLYIFLILLVLWYGVKLIRALYRRQQAKRRVAQLVTVEKALVDEDGEGRFFGIWRRRTALEKHFRALLRTLSVSELSRHGDPLYVLPWIAVVGESGDSGLGQLIECSRLSAPSLEVKPSDDNQTGIDWHLYNRSLLISTPADFAAIATAMSDPRWLELLGLLARHRQVEPLNSLIVCVPAVAIVSSDTEGLIERAQKIRRLIEDSVQLMSVQVPVYVLVSGLEALSGLDEWLDSLDDDTLLRAVGQLSGDQNQDTAEQLAADAVDALARQIRLMNLQTIRNEALSPDLMRLPVRVRDMTHALQVFVSNLFESNPYQKTPLLRGIYFSAMTQRREHKLSAFTFDLFSQIVPAERSLVTKVASRTSASVWRSRGKTLAPAAATGLLLFILSALYINDRSELDQIRDIHTQSVATADPSLSGAIELALNDRQQELALIQVLQERRWLPWVLSGAEPAFIGRMRAQFATSVQQDLIEPIDEAFVNSLENDFFNTEFSPDNVQMLDAVGAYTGILVRRVNLLNAYINGATADELRAMPLPYDAGEVQVIRSNLLGDINELFLQSLLWRGLSIDGAGDAAEVLAQRDRMVGTLDRILGHSGGSLQWIIQWLNNNPNYSGYELADLWGAGSLGMESDVRVPGAFTLAGKEAIESYIGELRQASPNSTRLDILVPRFFALYQRQYLGSWEQFALQFQRGLDKLATADEYLIYINNLSTGRNLYFSALNLVYNQVNPVMDDVIAQEGELNDWLMMLDYYNDMVSLSPDESADTSARDKTLAKLALKTIGSAGPLGKALAKQGKSGMKTKKKLDKAGSGPSASERALRLEETAALLDEYRAALSDFVFNAERQSVAYGVMRDRFQNADNPGGGTGSLASAHNAIRKIQALTGKPNPASQAFWTLFTGPIQLIEQYALQEAACYFNDQYRNNFLAELEAVPEFRKPAFTYGPEGVLWQFMDSTAQPFVSRRLGAGYVRASAGELRMPVTSDLLRYATRAEGQRNPLGQMPVEIRTRPTQTNLDALYGVSETRLTLQCPSNSATLRNRNFENEAVFTWNPQCADTTLRLSIGGIELEKVYSGPAGFPTFLDDFRSGSKRFTPADFPRYEQQLREYGVTYIDPQYILRGHQEILRLLDSRPGQPPQQAAACWNPGR
jgi:type VI secretion system protein ImpL